MRLSLPVGSENFSEIRENGQYYVDKTGFIEELLIRNFKVNLFTRPRRFGKTLMMSMLAAFLDIEKKSEDLFEGLSISKNVQICNAWMNQYPVIFLTLKAVEGLHYQSAYEMLRFIISDWCMSHYFLKTSTNLKPEDKELFTRFVKKDVTEEELKNSLYTLSKFMKLHYGKSVIILIDEYDVPLAKAGEKGYYEEMMDFIRIFLGTALKTNEYLKFAVITGCLRIVKESIFTGLNNFVSNSISSDRYSQYFGFMEPEVLELLKIAELESYADEMKRWYNGYRFGKTDMYCPWDVLNYVSDLQDSKDAFPGNYWKNTSHNGIIRSFIDRTDLVVNHKFETLLSGGYIQEKITEDLTYDVLHSSEQNLWSILYMTGYLTKVKPEQIADVLPLEHGKTYLKIPNEEIKSIFEETIATWFADTMQQSDRKVLFEAFWDGNDERVTKIISDILFETISYYDYKEDYYHAFLAGIFTGAGYAVESNKEYGLGRPDVVVKDRKHRCVIIIEVKHSKNEDCMETDAKTAMEQIDVKQYAKQFLKGYRTVMCYGAAFFEKDCVIRRVCDK